jgi:hypothetical protein
LLFDYVDMLFLRAKIFGNHIAGKYKFKDPIVKSIYTDRFSLYKHCQNFKVFLSVEQASKSISILQHLDVFKFQ